MSVKCQEQTFREWFLFGTFTPMLTGTNLASVPVWEPSLEGKEPNVETEMCAGGGHLFSIDERAPRFGCTMGNRSLLF